MSDSQELARQLEEERQANDTLRRLGEALTAELDLDRLVQLLTAEAAGLCGAEWSGFVPRFDGATPLRSDDLGVDARVAGRALPGVEHDGRAARSYLAVPLLSRRTGVVGALFFGHSQPGRFSERDERTIAAVAAQAAVAFDNARLYAEAKRLEERFRFLAESGDALAASLDYTVTLRQVARLAVPRIADWCTISVIDEHDQLRRIAAVHKDPARQALMEEYERNFPPAQHRAGGLMNVVGSGRTVFQPHVSDEDLAAAAQSPAHLELMRAVGCTSCVMIPLLARGRILGVISLMCSDQTRRLGDDDCRVAEALAHRAALAVDNALLYRAMQEREATTAFLADASALLGSSLDYATTLQSLAKLVVPRFADWCSVDILEEGRIRRLATAHIDPAKVAYAVELERRWPADPDAPTGSPNVIRTGKPELFSEIPEAVVAALPDPEMRRVVAELGLRSVLTVPLAARGRTLGALSLVWAESGRRYDAEDVPLMEELGRRAGLAVDNARLYQESQTAAKLREEFLSIASHELRTPLTSMQLQVSSLLRVLKHKPEQLAADTLAGKLEQVDRQVDRLALLIGALLDVSRATSGQLTFDYDAVDLGELVRQTVARLEPDLRGARCEVQLTLADGIVGRWDRLRLEQIVTNLVSNALKYGAGRPIEISARRDGDKAALVVRDHGIGIARADQGRIFERFARAVPASNFGGLGLGLWIVRVFVEAMGGTIGVQSEPSSGAEFTVTLPLVAREAASPT